MQIGFAINEVLCLLTLITGAAWLAWQRRVKTGRAGKHKPLWVTFGAELFVVAGLMFTCRIAVADWPKVPSGSMEPTLRVGDYLLVNHLAYGPRLPFTNTAIEFGRPQRGDVVVFRYPVDVSSFYVKRVVGVPGDRVEFHDGVVTVNGQPSAVQRLGDGTRPEDKGQWLLNESLPGATGDRGHDIKINPFVQGRLTMPDLMRDDLFRHCRIDRPGAWTCVVPQDHYLMLGDNRDNSSDSRSWGFLPHREVYGKAVRVLVNFSDFSRMWKAL